MALETSRLGRDLSRLEKVAALIMIAILFALFMRKADSVAAEAERTLLIARLQDIYGRLATQRADLMVRPTASAQTLDGLVRALGRGELLIVAHERGFDWSRVRPGEFVYFRELRRLDYLLQYPDYFVVAARDPPRIRFQVEPRYVDSNGNGRYDEPADTLSGADVKLLDVDALNREP
jgi:hypothetical protein